MFAQPTRILGLLALGMQASVQAASSCSVILTQYSDTTCTTVDTTPDGIFGDNGQVSVDLDFGKCLATSRGGRSIEMMACDEKKLVAAFQYSDKNCVTALSSDPVLAFSPGLCTVTGSSKSVKLSNAALTGNKFGIGWQEGWGIFLCQTLLFGVCDGY